MKIALTNVGHRRALSLLHPAAGEASVAAASVAVATRDPLVRLLSSIHAPWNGGSDQRDLLAHGWIEIVPDSTETRTIARRLRRNPVENVAQAVIEFTTRCNFSCAHCYNAGVERVTEGDLESLAAATDALFDMGVREFAFIGGEVSKYGDGWLDLAKRLRSRGADIVGILSNGWFLAQEGFEAAGKRYADTAQYLADLREHGVTHVSFSLDGRGEEHDRSRGVSGLYGRVLAGFAAVLEAGMKPRVALLEREGGDSRELLAELSRLLYADGSGSIWFDHTNIISNFVDLGNGALSGGSLPFAVADVKPGQLRCAGFYRPAPHITLKANGELSTCRLANAGEGYGNFHERPLADILNRMQDSFVYRLHAERLVGEYLRFVDAELFGRAFSHLCGLRAVVTMIARRMHEQGVEPGDAAGIARINREVAAVTGHIKKEEVHG